MGVYLFAIQFFQFGPEHISSICKALRRSPNSWIVVPVGLSRHKQIGCRLVKSVGCPGPGYRHVHGVNPTDPEREFDVMEQRRAVLILLPNLLHFARSLVLSQSDVLH